MPDQNMQPPQNDMTPDEHAAALGFITTLGSQVMGAQNATDPTQTPDSAPTGEETPEPQEDLTPRIEGLEGQFNEFKEEIKKDIKDEMEGLKGMIKDALAADNPDEQA